MSEYMVLDADRNVVPADLMTWAAFFDDRKARHVGLTKVGKATVSTVFLGIDHSLGVGPPLWFETMIFGGLHDEATWRYTTWAEAQAGHRRIIAALRDGLTP